MSEKLKKKITDNLGYCFPQINYFNNRIQQIVKFCIINAHIKLISAKHKTEQDGLSKAEGVIDFLREILKISQTTKKADSK